MRLSVRIALTPPYTFLAQLVEQRSFNRRSRVRAPQGVPYALLAQLAEQRILNPKVVGSIPSRRTIICVLSSVGRATDC